MLNKNDRGLEELVMVGEVKECELEGVAFSDVYEQERNVYLTDLLAQADIVGKKVKVIVTVYKD